MNEIRHPISDSQNPFSEGLFVAGRTKEQIESYGLFFNNLYIEIGSTRNALTMLQGAIFALGAKKLNNPEWKEHCAGSLREIIHEWKGSGGFQSDFNKHLRNKDNRLTQEEKEVFRELQIQYQYFSGIHHHDAAGIMGSLHSLLKGNSLKLEDCYCDEVFLGQVKKFFSNIEKIIGFSESEK